MLNISKISQIGNISKIKPQRVSPYMTQGLQRDTFERSNVSFNGLKKELDLQEVTTTLTELKTPYGYDKFTKGLIDSVKDILTETPEKWTTLKKLAVLPNMDGSSIETCAKQSVEKLEIGLDIASVKDKNTDREKFTGSEVASFVQNMDIDKLKKVKDYATTSLKKDNIKPLVNNENINSKKLAKKLCEIDKTVPVKNAEVTCDTDKHEEGALVVKYKGVVLTYSALLDKNYEIAAIEEVKKESSPSVANYEIKKVKDLRNNTISKVRSVYDRNSKLYTVTNEVRIKKDEKGKTLFTECTDLSPVKGVYNIKRINADGTIKQLSEGKIDSKTGIKTVKKDMESVGGVRTQYLYSDDPQGNRIIDYKITDKNGKELMNYSQSFEVVDENNFISSKNGKSYNINLNENIMSIKENESGKETKIDLKEKITGSKGTIINVLKQMPGEELIKVGENIRTLNGIDNYMKSGFQYLHGRIIVGDNLFTCLHELGHMKDLEVNEVDYTTNKLKSDELDGLFKDEKLRKAYQEEKKAFNEAFPNAQREHITYFINGKDHYNGENGALRETIAESNALLNTYHDSDLVSIRAQYLQQHFPKTIAELSKLLNSEND